MIPYSEVILCCPSRISRTVPGGRGVSPRRVILSVSVTHTNRLDAYGTGSP